MRFARILWRLVVLTVSLVVSTGVVVIAGMKAFLPFLAAAGARIEQFPPDRVPEGLMALMAPVMLVAVALAHAFAPWIVAVTVTELMRWRSLLVHLGAGLVVAVVAGLTTGAALLPATLQVLAALGLLGGFVHWLIAGRNAGRWSEGMIAPEPSSADPGSRP